DALLERHRRARPGDLRLELRGPLSGVPDHLHRGAPQPDLHDGDLDRLGRIERPPRLGGIGGAMGKYILRRLLIAIPTLLAITFVVFAILSLAPTDPLSQFGADPRVPPEVRERIREALGLNDPWPIRYVKWLTSVAHLDFGYSFMSRGPVMDLIGQRLPNTLAVVGVAYVIGVLLAVPIGMVSAIKRYSVFDHLATTFAFMSFSVPTVFTGLLLISIFSVKLHWLPFIYDSTLRITSLSTLGDQIRQSIMPITVLALFDTATIARYTRAEMLEHLPLDYVRTARAKGLKDRLVV